MSNTRIRARITDQAVELVNVPLIASGSVGVLQIQCEFDSLWSGYSKTAVFYKTEDEVYHVALSSDIVTVPQEVLAEDGEFFFGVMGVSENTRTTEVVRLQVKQGAISTATAKPAAPTPDIYDQLIAQYGSIDARFSEMIAMKGAGNATEHTLSDEYINGKITTNGAVGYINFTISGLSLAAGGNHYTDFCVPPELASLCQVWLESTNADLNVAIRAASEANNGWSRILIENVGSGMYTTDMVTTIRGFYPLATMFVAELADMRVTATGKTYNTAGEALRDQMTKRPAMHGIPDAERYGHLTANLDQGFYRIHREDWADLPGTEKDSPLALLVFWYTTYYNIQIVYSMKSDMVAYRIVRTDTRKVYKDWFIQSNSEGILGSEKWLKDITDTLTIKVGAVNATGGGIIESRTQGRATEPFPVKEGEVYHIWGTYNRIYCLVALYDESKSYIGYLGSTDLPTAVIAENEIITIPATVTDPSGTSRIVAYMACSTMTTYEGGSGVGAMSLMVKKEVIKYTTGDDLVKQATSAAVNKQDKVLLSPNGARWVLTISDDGTLAPIKLRAKAGEVDTTLTLPTTLSAGTYALKYENANGALPDYLDICTLEVTASGEAVSYTGLIAENCAPEGTTAVGVYDAVGNRVAGIDLGFLGNQYSGKLYSFGAISDVHIGQADSIEDFTNAVTYFNADNDIKFVTICGDMVDSSSNKTQLANYQSIVKKAKKPVYVTTGNHEALKYASGENFDSIKHYFAQDDFPWVNKQLYYTFGQNDDVFIMFGISGTYNTNRTFTDEQLRWLQQTLETYRNQRCFLFMHYFPWDGSGDAVNCYGENGLAGSRGQVFQELLKHYKNVIWFHGHSHAMFKVQELNAGNTIDRTYGRYSVHIPSLTWPSYPNAEMTDYYKNSAAGEGYIVDVYEHGIALRGRDFESGAFSPIGSYYLDTVIEEIPANTFWDVDGILDTPIP